MPTLVYILWSSRLEKFYIGITINLARRLREHNRGKSPFMKAGAPWKLVWRSWKGSKGQAMRLERTLKNMKSSERVRCFIEKYAEDKV